MKHCQVCAYRIAMRTRFEQHPWFRCHACHRRLLIANKPQTNQERLDT